MENNCSLREVLVDELRHLYQVESQLMCDSPRWLRYATQSKLRESVQQGMEDRCSHLARLGSIAEQLEVDLKGTSCRAVSAMLSEVEDRLLGISAPSPVSDVILASMIERIELYAIASYGTAVCLADALDEEELVDLLQCSLDEEYLHEQVLRETIESNLIPNAAAPRRACESKQIAKSSEPIALQP